MSTELLDTVSDFGTGAKLLTSNDNELIVSEGLILTVEQDVLMFEHRFLPVRRGDEASCS